MDQLRGKTTDTAKARATASSAQAPVKDPMAGYTPKAPARQSPGDANVERITTNLNRINRRYVATPVQTGRRETNTVTAPAERTSRRAVRIPTTRADNASITRRRVLGNVKTRVELVTDRDTTRKPFPFAVILGCLAVTAMFMYTILLYSQIDDYTASISHLKGQIAQVQDEQTALELRLENQYDLDEIERVAVEEYGMVRADQLPKKYVSLAGKDVVEITKPEQASGLGKLLSVFASLFGFAE